MNYVYKTIRGKDMTKQSGRRMAGWMVVVALVLTVLVPGTQASSSLAVKKALFQKADRALGEADTHKTRFFAPTVFAEAMGIYKSAENDYAHERSMKEINDKLDRSMVLFADAVRMADEAERQFRDTDLARNDAHKVMASRFKPDQWGKAEDAFKRAIAKFERGQRPEAVSLADEARALYEQVEQDTIAYSYLAKVWDNLKTIDGLDGGSHLAPKTYARAVQLAELAQTELKRQAYGNEKAKKLISEAQAEAEYALKLTRCIKTLTEQGKTLEDLFIDDLITRDTLDRISTPRS
jgi:hypothetical protein